MSLKLRQKKGEYGYSCGMNMMHGQMIVNKGVGMKNKSSCGKRSAKDPYYSRKGL